MKKIISFLLALTMLIMGMCILTSCGDDDSNGNNENNGNNDNGSNSAVKVDYTFTLVDQYDDGVEGVKVEFRVGPKTKYEATTDEDGVAKINIEETALPIRVVIPAILPVGYENAGAGYVDFESGAKSANASLVKNVAHTVYVTDAEGNAISGANVQVCVDGVCKIPVDTDADGKAVFYVSPDAEEAYAQFNSAPDGYNAPESAKIYYTDGETEVTFVITAK